MTSSTRAKPANLPATYQRRELRVQQPDGSLLTLDEHLELNSTQPWTSPGTDSDSAQAETP